MKAIITGGAGFIGSQLADALLDKGWKVVSLDIIPLDSAENIRKSLESPDYSYISRDIAKKGLGEHENVDWVFHLAANSDIKVGGQNPDIDFEKTLLTTKACLDFMRESGVGNLFFSSTSAIYGDKPGIKLTENEGGLRPISYYGACKLASEALISAHTYMNGTNSLVFRFPNVVGPRLTHGVIFDFIAKLKKNPKRLEILGNGLQSKQYVYAPDLVKGIVDFSEKNLKGHNVFNISTESFTSVNEIADFVVEGMGLKNVEYEYTGGSAGWLGDVSTFDYDVSKAKEMGWSYRYDSNSAVRKAVEDVLKA